MIIGPRTHEQLDDPLSAVDVRLEDAILDHVDETVPPGTSLDRADNHVVEQPALTDRALRPRRH